MWGEGRRGGEGRRNRKDQGERWIGFGETEPARRAAATAGKARMATTWPAAEAVKEEEIEMGIYSC